MNLGVPITSIARKNIIRRKYMRQYKKLPVQQPLQILRRRIPQPIKSNQTPSFNGMEKPEPG